MTEPVINNLEISPKHPIGSFDLKSRNGFHDCQEKQEGKYGNRQKATGVETYYDDGKQDNCYWKRDYEVEKLSQSLPDSFKQTFHG